MKSGIKFKVLIKISEMMCRGSCHREVFHYSMLEPKPDSLQQSRLVINSVSQAKAVTALQDNVTSLQDTDSLLDMSYSSHC